MDMDCFHNLLLYLQSTHLELYLKSTHPNLDFWTDFMIHWTCA